MSDVDHYTYLARVLLVPTEIELFPLIRSKYYTIIHHLHRHMTRCDDEHDDIGRVSDPARVKGSCAKLNGLARNPCACKRMCVCA